MKNLNFSRGFCIAFLFGGGEFYLTMSWGILAAWLRGWLYDYYYSSTYSWLPLAGSSSSSLL
jgi:hypothetical protein